MEPKYKIGDRVTVVHRMQDESYYSYTLDGSIGVVDGTEFNYDGRPIYHLVFDDVVVAHPEPEGSDGVDIKNVAWFNECCLDPAPLQDTVELEDFESVLG